MNNKWFPLPRYIFRKKNILAMLDKVDSLSTVVDIGCGAGDLLCTIVSKYGGEGVGYDFAENAIAEAKELRDSKYKESKDKIEFIVNQNEDLSDVIKKFDVVLCTEVLEHVEDDAQFFSNLVSLSNKYIIFSVPAKKKLFTHSDVLAGHFRRYERKDVYELANREGLKIISVINYGYPFTDIIRFFRELFAANALKNNKSNKKDRTKQSGIHIFNVGKFFSHIPFEIIVLPFYYISRLFNKFDLSEGILVIAKK